MELPPYYRLHSAENPIAELRKQCYTFPEGKVWTLNAVNRGSLRAIRVTLDKIDDIIWAIHCSENNKERGVWGGAPIEAQHGNKSDDLENIHFMLQDVIDQIDMLVPDECDWE